MRLLALALLFPAVSFALDFADPDIDGKLKKAITAYPAQKAKLEKAHSAWLVSTKSDCEFLASIKGNNVASSSVKDCIFEATEKRANLYEQIEINKN